MSTGPLAFFLTAFLVAELSAFFAGLSLSSGSQDGLFISLAFMAASTLAGIVTYLADI